MFTVSRYLKNTIRNISTSNKRVSRFHGGIRLVFGKYLLATNTISSGALMLLGDLCQQEIEYRQQKLAKRYDGQRLTRMFIVGLGLGPLHHYYYLYLAKMMPKRDFITVTKKVALDQFVMSPLCIAAFFYSLGTLERKSLHLCTKELADKYLEVYVMDWCVWPPTQYINFYYFPVKFQVLWVNAVTMLYNIFLSYIKHRELATENARKIASGGTNQKY